MAERIVERRLQGHQHGHSDGAICVAGRKPLVDNLGDGLWEVRSRLSNRIARTLFAIVDQEIVLLHGFIKKQRRTPPDELELAKKRKKQYLEL